jgi:hypothetical protein
VDVGIRNRSRETACRIQYIPTNPNDKKFKKQNLQYRLQQDALENQRSKMFLASFDT